MKHGEILGLRHFERDGQSALLAFASKLRCRAVVEQELHVVAVRADQGRAVAALGIEVVQKTGGATFISILADVTRILRLLEVAGGVKLDDLVEWEKLPRLDYLKIDAESAEPLILQGGEAAIRKFRPVIQVETTLTSVKLPPDYEAWAYPKGYNELLVPREHSIINRLESFGYRSKTAHSSN